MDKPDFEYFGFLSERRMIVVKVQIFRFTFFDCFQPLARPRIAREAHGDGDVPGHLVQTGRHTTELL